MLDRTKLLAIIAAIAVVAPISGIVAPVWAQVVDEDFENVTETGGGVFFSGSGHVDTNGWDDGIFDENAFGGTYGYTQVDAVSADGTQAGGVGGSGAGELDVTGAAFNMLDEDFETVTGTGGGAFLTGGVNTSGYTDNWDDGISDEYAFGGTFDGAEVNGSMSAQGVISGGVGGGGGGEVVVTDIATNGGGWFAGMFFSAPAFPGAAPLVNPGFEDGSLNGWTTFNNIIPNVLYDTITPRTGTGVCKMFGAFNGDPNYSGINQGLPAEYTQIWRASSWIRTNTDDSIKGTANRVVMKIEYYNVMGGTWGSANWLGDEEITIYDGTSNGLPEDTWIFNSLESTAPAETVEARIALGGVNQ